MDVYRGSQLDQSEIKAYSEAIGEYKCWLGFTSTTKNREVAQMFGDTLFIIDASSCGGSDISLLSQFTDEEEVLLPAGATFKIHKVVFDQETQKYCIFLELLPEVRLVVLGKTGTGKSSFGNTVLAREQFEADCAFESITTRCSVGLRVFNDKNWVIVDTPGFFDTKLPKQQVQREVAGSYQITAPGPHVFLVVVELGRFTEEEERAVEWITKIFGDRAVDYCIIIFTHLDKIIKAKKKKTVDKYLQNANPALIKLLDKCDNRYIAVDNTASDDAKEQTLKDLSDKISKMIAKNGERFYTTSEFQQVAMQLKKVAKETRCKFNPLKSDGTVNVLPEVEKIVACELDIS
ncbi:unnamed protein product [Didymodactylos carnosus]|uniref:NAD(P)(+)--arginine ADP-ribosyltransferase n=1 Tax=Didymodactylos carnosus TaxID=1234261 RepID=A0A814ZM99_9BILA|nr:unnamed protein product [Didymodactylos carnosus]CAF1254133.1 unnamed protein product [Didymodactylos carnosus]CAF4008013.1 unnamed protein product [Didymodactylos carnosus]CAF4061194.1 unnamed protein product [Didymodactylos carnosus]